MPTKYTVRVASNVQYEYWEAEADTFEEMLSAEQELRELKGGSRIEQAVNTVTKTFGKTSNVTAGSFGNKGQQSQQSLPEKVELGQHDGYAITLYPKGKFGPYVNAYQKGANPERINANLPKGADPSQIGLPEAIEILNEAA
jgi:topoisomerase IA-like protein